MISAPFFMSVSCSGRRHEQAGRDAFRVQSGEKKGGYFIERGVAGKTVQVVVYRKKRDGEIKALVVAYL